MGEGLIPESYMLRLQLREQLDRIEALENKVNRTAKKDSTSRGQQILLMHHLGLLDKVKELGLNNTQQAKLLSVLLNAGQENIRKDLSNVESKESELKLEMNYNFLVELFGELKLEKQEFQAEKILKQIQDRKMK